MIHRLAEMTDAGLRRLAVEYRRAGQPEGAARVRSIIARRMALRQCWFAREGGVDGSADFWRQFDEPGGCERYLSGLGVCPSYRLAAALDEESYRRTGKSALAWEAQARPNGSGGTGG